MILLLRLLFSSLIWGYLPGLLLERLWWGFEPPVRGIERQVLRVVPSVLLTGWLALLLAEFGWFSFGLLLMLVAGMLVLVAGYLWRQQRLFARPRRGWTGFDWALAGLALIFALLVARPFELIRGGLDAGVYPLTGFAIARTGSIVQTDPLAADIGGRAAAGEVNAQHVRNQLLKGGHPQRFLNTGLRASGFGIIEDDFPAGRVVPQFFHLWPTWIAVFTSAGTPFTGLIATGAAALLGVVLLALLGRQLAGPRVGLFAAALLTLSIPQVWFGRMPTSEALAQALTLAGLWAFSHFAVAPSGRAGNWWGLLAGAAFGELALTRIDGFWAIGPTVALLAYVFVTRRWRSGYSWLAVTLGVLALHSLLHTLIIARAYFFETGFARLQDFAITTYASLPFLTDQTHLIYTTKRATKVGNYPRLAAEIGVLLAACAVFFACWRRPRSLLALEDWVRRRQDRFLLGWMLLLGAAAVYAYFIRPGILTAAVLRNPFGAAEFLQLQGYVGAPIALPEGLNKTALKIAQQQANLVRIGWYVSPVGILLGAWGGLQWWRRGLNRCSWLLLVIATAYIVVYVLRLYGTDDATYIYILRRYVPLVFPAWMLGIAYALFGPHAPSGQKAKRYWRVGALALAGLLMAFFLWTGRPVYRHVEYEGAFAQFQALADQLEPQDVLLVRTSASRDQADIPAAPLTYLYQRNALTFKGSDPLPYGAALAEQVTRWQAEGRAVYVLLGANSGDWQLPGWDIEVVTDWTWQYREYEQPQDHKPSQAGPLQTLILRLYRVVPAAIANHSNTVSVLDTAWQLGGFYRVEPSPEGPVAWTAAAATLRLPSREPGTQLRLEASGGVRPIALEPAQVCVRIMPDQLPVPDAHDPRWQELGCVPLGRQRQSLRWDLPPVFHEQPLLIQLQSRAWVPSSTPSDPGQPRSTDQRELGIRFYSIARLP